MHPDNDVLDAVDCLRHTLHIKYNDPDLEAKAWPTLFPYGCGSWNECCGTQLAEYQKHRLLDVDPRFRNDPFWSFFNFDRRTKRAIAGYNRNITIDPKTTMAKTTGDVRAGMKRTHSDARNTPAIGTYVPNTVPASKSYWKARLLDVLAMSRELGKPSFFITLTMNDNWPELRAFMEKHSQRETGSKIDSEESPVDYTVASIVAYMRRWELYKQNVLQTDNGPFGKVTASWWRHEFQKRGAIHTHLAIWCDPKHHPTKLHTHATSARKMRRPSYLTTFCNSLAKKSMDQLHRYCPERSLPHRTERKEVEMLQIWIPL